MLNVRYTVNKEYAEFRKCGIRAEFGKTEYMEFRVNVEFAAFRKCGMCRIR